LAANETARVGEPASRADDHGAPLKIFINYRRRDTRGDSQALYDRLVEHFGEENVFRDVDDLAPGVNWQRVIKAEASSRGAFLALIGPDWLTLLHERERASRREPLEDQVVREIEFALQNTRVNVIPLFVGGAELPADSSELGTIGSLTRCNARRLGEASFDRDVRELIDELDGMEFPDGPAPPPPDGERRTRMVDPRARSRAAPVPGESHYEAVIGAMVRGSLVPVLGPRVNAADRDEAWHEGCGALPDATELAADLARRFGLKGTPDLAEVAQHVYITPGPGELYKQLRKALAVECNPTVHRFLASLPRKFEELGLEPNYQMILTTNYDTSLERAFSEERGGMGEPFDLVVYMATGAHKGKFVYVPHGGEPELIEKPNSDTKLDIGEFGELNRPLIVKIHGGPVASQARRAGGASSLEYDWSRNYVITEDHYIDYLSGGVIGNLVPWEILKKLEDSQCLFLGYGMRDWILRVFLKRIWSGRQLGENNISWAIESEPEELEAVFWKKFLNVDLFEANLDDYVEQLDEQLLTQRITA
jgi:hypothetical protein